MTQREQVYTAILRGCQSSADCAEMTGLSLAHCSSYISELRSAGRITPTGYTRPKESRGVSMLLYEVVDKRGTDFESAPASAESATPILDEIINTGHAAIASAEPVVELPGNLNAEDEAWTDMAVMIRKIALEAGADQETYHSMLVLPSPLFVGFDPALIATLTGVPRHEVDRYGQSFLDSGAWRLNEDVYLGEYAEDNDKQFEAGLELVMLGMVGSGQIQMTERGMYRSVSGKDGQP